MFLTDVVVVLAILLFVAAVAIELRRDRDKKMYVGGEAKTRQESSYTASSDAPVLPPDKLSGQLPVVPPEAGLPVVTQEELPQDNLPQDNLHDDLNERKKSA